MSVGLVNVSLYIKNYLWKTVDTIPAEPFDTSNIEQPASVISATTDINIETPKKDAEDAFTKCDLNTGEWVRWLGAVNQDFEDKTHFILPTNSSGAQMNYPAASRPHTPLSLRKAGYRWRNSILEQ
jgi:hypothetical protein